MCSGAASPLRIKLPSVGNGGRQEARIIQWRKCGQLLSYAVGSLDEPFRSALPPIVERASPPTCLFRLICSTRTFLESRKDIDRTYGIELESSLLFLFPRLKTSYSNHPPCPSLCRMCNSSQDDWPELGGSE